MSNALPQQFRAWLVRTSLKERQVFFDWLIMTHSLDSISTKLATLQQEIPEEVLTGWLVYRLDNLAWSVKLETSINEAEYRAFRAWQQQLSIEAQERIYQSLAAFCAEIGMDLEWLLDELMRLVDPEVKTLREAVFLHWLGLWKADQVKDYIDELQLFQKWQANLSDDEYRQVNELIFSKLAQKGLVPTPPPDLWTSPETKRNYLATIDNAMTEHSQTMRNIIKTIWRELV